MIIRQRGCLRLLNRDRKHVPTAAARKIRRNSHIGELVYGVASITCAWPRVIRSVWAACVQCTNSDWRLLLDKRLRQRYVIIPDLNWIQLCMCISSLSTWITGALNWFKLPPFSLSIHVSTTREVHYCACAQDFSRHWMFIERQNWRHELHIHTICKSDCLAYSLGDTGFAVHW